MFAEAFRSCVLYDTERVVFATAKVFFLLATLLSSVSRCTVFLVISVNDSNCNAVHRHPRDAADLYTP